MDMREYHYQHKPSVADQRLHYLNRRKKIFGIKFALLLALEPDNTSETCNSSLRYLHNIRIDD